jgi:hypothetical protein
MSGVFTRRKRCRDRHMQRDTHVKTEAATKPRSAMDFQKLLEARSCQGRIFPRISEKHGFAC